MATKKQDVTPASILETFSNNLNTVILYQAKDQSSPPTFTGSANYNNSYNNINTSTGFINPPAIPINDLDFKSNSVPPTISVGSKKSDVSGSVIYNTLCDVVKKLTRVRNFTSTWYHKTQGSYAMINTVSGKAVFKETLPAVQGTGGIADNTASSGWTRSIDGTTLQNIAIVNPGVERGKDVLASTINQFFTNLNTSWSAAAVNTIAYTFYSCHNNCHNNCHSSCHGSGRSRR
jgi:hypothetical protein